MSVPAVPLRTPMFDGRGNLDRTWILFFQSLGSSSAASSSASDEGYIVPIVAGVATPDASKGTNVLTLTADTQVAAPINFGTDSDIAWDLITREDATGGWAAIFDSSYYMTTAIATAQSPASTQCHVGFKTTPAGNTYIAGAPSIDQPIPPA